MKNISISISLFIGFFSLSFIIGLVNDICYNTIKSKKIQYINIIIKSILITWITLIMLFSIFGVKTLLPIDNIKDTTKAINTILDFSQSFTLFSIVSLFIASVFKLIFSISDIKDKKPEHYPKLYYFFKVCHVFGLPLLMLFNLLIMMFLL